MHKHFNGAIFIVIMFLMILFVNSYDVLAIKSNVGHTRLLAVQETTSGDYHGNIADIYLEIRSGSGRVFLDTFPLSKIDTQISTRFAKEYVCDYLDINCNKYDFIYTIRSDSFIIGGPSAGAAIASLTFATLDGLDVDESVAITGTINSGGLVGYVSGLKAKIDAASVAGIETVLIPGGKALIEENNVTIDLIDYGEDRGVVVREIYNLDDALYYMTGRAIPESENFVVPNVYGNRMKLISEIMCNKTYYLHQQMVDLTEFGLSDDELKMANDFMDKAINLTSKAESSLEFDNHYSAASFCFGANINYQNIIMLQKDMSNQSLAEYVQNVEYHIDEYESSLKNMSIETLSDFQTYMVVLERIISSRDFLDAAKSSFSTNKYSTYYNLAYAIERLESAHIWSNFFGMPGKKFEINEKRVEESCVQKIAEAQERYQYVQLFLPDVLSDIKKDIDRSLVNYKDGDYELCISMASQAKARVNVLLSVVGLPEENLEAMLYRKLEAAKKTIIREQNKGVFPILGYSYYEYANSLKYSDLYSSLIYAEDALEMSTLDIYFKSDISELFDNRFNIIQLIVILIGFSIMIIIFASIFYSSYKNKGKRRRTKIRRNF